MESQHGKTDFASVKTAIRSAYAHVASGKAPARAFGFVSGFALAFAAMGSSFSPFGLSFVAMCRKQTVFAALGAFCGYMLAFGTGGLTYAAAVLICFTCHIVFKDTRAGKHPYLMPFCAFLSLLCVKMPVALTQGMVGFIVLVCEAVLCAGFCLLFETASGRQKPSLRTAAVWGRLAVAIAVLLIFLPVRVLGDVSPARIFAVICVMTVSCFGGSALGSGAGVALGAFMDIAGGTVPFFATAYGFSGLLGGVGSERGRFVCAVCHVLANCVATMWSFGHAAAIPGLFECFIASVLFVMMPDALFDRLAIVPAAESTKQPPGQRAYTAGRLQAVSNAIGELGNALDGFKTRIRPESGDITKVYDRAAEKVCRRCPTASVCWSREYISTHNALGDVTAKLKRENALNENDFPAYFVSRCAHLRSFIGAINEEYRAYLRRLASERRDSEARALLSRQYAGLKGVLDDAAGWAGEFPEYFPAFEARVKSIAKAYCAPQRVSVYSRAGRMHVELTLAEGDSLSDADAFMQSLTLALKRTFWPPEILPAQKGSLIRISQRERLKASVSCAMRRKTGESVSGDSSAHLHTDDGRAVIMLSDGMGTGGAASAASSKSVELISGFVQSGCGLLESTRAVLPVLAARFEQAGFVTLDLLEINLFTGHTVLVKLGAVPSFALRGGQVERLGAQSLPAGLSPVGEIPEPTEIKLDAQDRIVMLSDGVWENADTEQILKSVCEGTAEQISGSLISAAVESGAVDDMSVIVITLAPGNE